MKPSKTIKYDEGEKYIFIGNKAIVPNMLIANKPVIITLQEFKELINSKNQGA